MISRISLFGLLLAIFFIPFRAAPMLVAQNPPVVSPACLGFGQAQASRRGRTGSVRFVGTESGRPIRHPSPQQASASAETAARAYLATCGSLFDIQDQASEMRLAGTDDVNSRRTVVRLQQIKSGIPVFGGELIMHMDNVRNILAVVAKTTPTVGVDTTPGISAADAVQAALNVVAKTYSNAGGFAATTPELWIYDPGLLDSRTGFTTLVWRMDVTSSTDLTIREIVLIDAHRGAAVLHFNQIETARNRLTYTTNGGQVLPGTLVCNEANSCVSPPTDSHVAAAHAYAADTYQFYFTNFGRDSIDGAGLTITSTVHYGHNYQNAYWDSDLLQMVYGDGSGYPLADDVVGHELSHGVTQYTSNLFYYYQSGAINESLSDVFGEFMDLTNGHGNDTPAVRWLVGEDVTGPQGGAIRNMQNPPAFGDPDKMTSANYYTGAADSGGVHTNSGINNKAASFMVDGGTFNGKTITGIGITKAAAIYYEVQTHLLTSAADYPDLYDALYQGCNNLVGSGGITANDCTQVRTATMAVEMNLQPTANFNTEAPVCNPGLTPSDVFFDNLETDASQFAFSSTPAVLRWQYDSPYGPFAHSGLHFLYADDFPDDPSDASVAMTSSVTVPANAYLHFAHSFGFEGPAFDGGLVEYSVNGGLNWTDAGSLFDTNGYRGTLATNSGNPLGGRSAFVDDSHGYISSRLNLSSLAGQNVRFRWRMALDSAAYDWGWWLDDVRIYTCGKKRPGQITSS